MRSTGWLKISVLVLGAVFFSCGSDEPTKQEKVTKLLTQNGGRWEPTAAANSITLDGELVKDELFPSGFSITFTKTNLTTTGNSPLWYNEGTSNYTFTWSFKDKNADALIRGDGKEITIVEVTSSSLIIEMDWDETTYEGGRMKSLPGRYQFIMGK